MHAYVAAVRHVNEDQFAAMLFIDISLTLLAILCSSGLRAVAAAP
jgi:hypothetical protein